MVSSALTNANAPSTREALLKNYKDAINRALSSIRTQVTEENCDIPALQAVLQKALIDFVKGLGKNSEKAKSCVRDIEQVRRLIKRDILDDEESRLAFLQRAEEALDDAEEFIRDRVHLGTANFLDRLAAFRESDIKEAKIVIKRKVAELENQQKLLGAGTDASKLIDAQGAGDALAGAVPGEQYSSVVSFLVRLGITAGKNKGQDGVDERILELGEAQRGCSQVIISIDSFDLAAQSAWNFLRGCDDFPLDVQQHILLLRRFLSDLRRPAIAPARVTSLESDWSLLLTMMNCYQTTVSDIVELAPLFERRSMTIEVEDFGRHITDLHHVFNQLRTAKDIIEDAHQTLLLTRIHELSQRIVEQLGKIRDVFIRWHAYCTSGSADKFYFIPEILDMTRHIASFAWSVQPLYAQIKQIIRDGYHRKKAKKAQEKRKKELKNGISEVRGFRSLVSEAEALEVLERVDGILQGIAHFSTEFGAALLYFDGGRNGAAGQTSRDALQPCPRYPRNPFWVPDIITERVMNQLRFELGVLSQLPGAKN